MSGSRKGSKFEREICVKLSQWWTNGERDDIFWRTGGSGGRAKIRGRRGKDTKNQHGDICALDPIGQPLIDLITFELKNGYPGYSLMDLLDKRTVGKKIGKGVYEGWLEQAEESAEGAKSLYWMIIVKRNAKVPLAIFPMGLTSMVLEGSTIFKKPLFILSLEKITLQVVPLERFLTQVSPRTIIKHMTAKC